MIMNVNMNMNIVITVCYGGFAIFKKSEISKLFILSG